MDERKRKKISAEGEITEKNIESYCNCCGGNVFNGVVRSYVARRRRK